MPGRVRAAAILWLSLSALCAVAQRPAKQAALAADPARIFPLRVGEVRVFADQRSTVAGPTWTVGRTVFTVAARGAFACAPDAFELVIAKDRECVECYWGPGVPREVHFYVSAKPDGTIYSPGQWDEDYRTRRPEITIDFHGLTPEDRFVYALLTPEARAGQVLRSHYAHLAQRGVGRSDCLQLGERRVGKFGEGGLWTTAYRFGTVRTPAYSGPVVIARYTEGDDVPGRWPGTKVARSENNAEEWYFALAPPFGLVQLVYQHSAVAGKFYDGVHAPTLVLKLESCFGCSPWATWEFTLPRF